MKLVKSITIMYSFELKIALSFPFEKCNHCGKVNTSVPGLSANIVGLFSQIEEGAVWKHQNFLENREEEGSTED